DRQHPRRYRSLNDARFSFEDRYTAGSEDVVSLHEPIWVRMAAAKFPADRFPRPLDDGTRQSIVVREYGTNGSSEVLVETSLGRLLINSAFPDDFAFVDEEMKKREIVTDVGELVENYDKAMVADSLDRL